MYVKIRSAVFHLLYTCAIDENTQWITLVKYLGWYWAGEFGSHDILYELWNDWKEQVIGVIAHIPNPRSMSQRIWYIYLIFFPLDFEKRTWLLCPGMEYFPLIFVIIAVFYFCGVFMFLFFTSPLITIWSQLSYQCFFKW